MPLQLKSVPAARGVHWLRDAFRLFVRRPLAFSMMFVLFLFVAMALPLLPVVGGVLQMMSLPLWSLGFMVASQSALLGGPIKASQFIEPLRGDAARRRALLLLCLIYGVSAVAILLLCDAVSGGAAQRLMALMSQATSQGTPQGAAGQAQQVDSLLSEPGVAVAALLFVGGVSLLSVPFWHAPALVHWGAQGVGQALFSSTLAVWRSKGAFLVYGVAWVGLVMGFGLAAALLFGLLGAHQLASWAALAAGLVFSTVFYISLLFTFNDSFGGAQVPDKAPGGSP